MSDKCPKCGAERKQWKHEKGQMFECDTWIPFATDIANQSKECRIRELEAQLAVSQAECERLKAELLKSHEVHLMTAMDSEYIHANYAAKVEQAVKEIQYMRGERAIEIIRRIFGEEAKSCAR